MTPGRLAILLGLLCLALAFTLPQNPEDEIIVQDAEVVIAIPNSYSPDVDNLIATVQPRFVVQFGEAVRHIPLPSMPAPLRNELELIQARVLISYAERNKEYSLLYPSALPQDSLPGHLHYSTIYLPMIQKGSFGQ